MDFSTEPLSEDAVLLRFGDVIDATINAHVHSAARALHGADLAGVFDIAPAYASLLVRFDPAIWSAAADEPPFRHIAARLRSVVANANHPPRTRAASSDAGDQLENLAQAATQSSATIEIPVCYGGAFGPDLDAVATHVGLPAETVIERHAAGDYSVAMLGFAPGFAYLLGLDAALHVPRRADPRTRVPAGSVAIGGAQTGIYPRELPGGWNLIGRTPLGLFDPQSKPPALLSPGDRVRFRSIHKDEFAMLREKLGHGRAPDDSRNPGRSQA